MKILYFGTVCDLDNYENILNKCKSKPTVATVLFEQALLEGFKSNCTDIEIHSFPMIPAFPDSKLVYFGKIRETLKCGYECEWLNTINIPVLKQFSRKRAAVKAIKRWCKENSDDGVIMTYSIPPFMVKEVIKYSKKFSVKSVALVPDLPRDMYINSNDASFISHLKQKYLGSSLKMQSKYDGYIYLTKYMREVVSPEKPYIVMEGIANLALAAKASEKNITKKSVMYAGMLYEKYGIMNLVKAFTELDMPDAELWLFGEGNAVPDIKNIMKSDNRIKYFGRISHDDVLEYERKATLLINPRSIDEKFTKYSFPSKTIEYMLSGTPLITTKMKGIPDEYFDYTIALDSNSVDEIKTALKKYLSADPNELNNIAIRAQKFICENKNSHIQTGNILDFISVLQKRGD